MKEKHHQSEYKPHEADRLAVELEKEATAIRRFGYKGSFAVLFVAAFLFIGLALYGILSLSKGKTDVKSQQADASMLTTLNGKLARPVASTKQLAVSITPSQTTPGGSYTLTAAYINEYGQNTPYNGLLNYQLRFCPISGGTCQTSSGAWGDYTLSNGSVIVNLPSNTAQGIYNASFIPRTLAGFTWSNEASVTVASASVVNPPATTGNLVINGDFETPALPNNVEGWDTIPNGTPGLGWKLAWVNPSLHTITCNRLALEIQAGVNGWNSANGSRHAELDSDCGTGADKGIIYDALVDISQNLTTQAGKTYKVSFAFSARPGTDAGDNKLSVYFGGQRIANLSADGYSSTNNTEWQTYTYFVTATSSQSELKFSGKESQGDSLGIFIDNVKVERVQ